MRLCVIFVAAAVVMVCATVLVAQGHRPSSSARSSRTAEHLLASS